MTTTSTGAGEWNSVVGAYDISDDVIINHDVTYDDHINMTGSLTINASKTLGEGAASKNMNVDGHVSVDGTLDLNRSSSDGNATFDSIIINNGGQVDAPSHGTITILSEDASHAFRCSGGGTFNNNDGTVIIKTPAETRLKMNGTGNLHHLTVNHASCTLFMESDSSTTIEGNLTITAGTVNSNTQGGASRNLTVTGATSNYGTLTLNSSAFSTGNFRNYSSGVVPASTGQHTFTDALRNDNSYTFTNGNTLLTGRGVGNSGYLLDDQGSTMNYNSGTINIGNGTDIGGNTNIRPQASHDLNNLIINCTNSRKVILATACDIAGNLTLTAGELDTSGSNLALTVTGDVSVTGTLTGNASAISMGSLTIADAGTYNGTTGTTTILNEAGGYAWNNLETDGTGFVHNNGTVHFDFETGGGTNDTKAKELTWGHVKWTGDEPSHELTFEPQTGSTVTIAKDLTIHEGYCRPTVLSLGSWVVTEDVLIESGGTIGHVNHTGAITFGSLTVASGGTYIATSGTTTITKNTGTTLSGQTARAVAVHASGVFTHNKGLVKTTASSADVAILSQTTTNNPFWDFEAVDYGIDVGGRWVVLNNMTLGNGFQFNSSGGYCEVYGIMKQTGGTYNTGDYSTSNNHFFNHYRLEGGTLDLSAINITVGSIRNTGGTIS